VKLDPQMIATTGQLASGSATPSQSMTFIAITGRQALQPPPREAQMKRSGTEQPEPMEDAQSEPETGRLLPGPSPITASIRT
jgi:hypothetical protein